MSGSAPTNNSSAMPSTTKGDGITHPGTAASRKMYGDMASPLHNQGETYQATGTNFRSVLFNKLLNKTPAAQQSGNQCISPAGVLGIHRGIHDRWASGIHHSPDEEDANTVPDLASSENASAKDNSSPYTPDDQSNAQPRSNMDSTSTTSSPPTHFRHHRSQIHPRSTPKDGSIEISAPTLKFFGQGDIDEFLPTMGLGEPAMDMAARPEYVWTHVEKDQEVYGNSGGMDDFNRHGGNPRKEKPTPLKREDPGRDYVSDWMKKDTVDNSPLSGVLKSGRAKVAELNRAAASVPKISASAAQNTISSGKQREKRKRSHDYDDSDIEEPGARKTVRNLAPILQSGASLSGNKPSQKRKRDEDHDDSEIGEERVRKTARTSGSPFVVRNDYSVSEAESDDDSLLDGDKDDWAAAEKSKVSRDRTFAADSDIPDTASVRIPLEEAVEEIIYRVSDAQSEVDNDGNKYDHQASRETTPVDDLPYYKESVHSPEPAVEGDLPYLPQYKSETPLEQSVEENFRRVLDGKAETEDDGIKVATKESRFPRAPTPFNHPPDDDEPDSLSEQAYPGDELPSLPDYEGVVHPSEHNSKETILHEATDNHSDSVLDGDEEDWTAAKEMNIARDFNEWLENEPIQEDLDTEFQDRVRREAAGLLGIAAGLIGAAAALLRQVDGAEEARDENHDDYQSSQDKGVEEASEEFDDYHPASQPEEDVEEHFYEDAQDSASDQEFDHQSTSSEHTIYPELIAEARCRGIPESMVPRPIFFPNGHIDYNRTFNALESDYEPDHSDEDLQDEYQYEDAAPAGSDHDSRGYSYAGASRANVNDAASSYGSEVPGSSWGIRTKDSASNSEVTDSTGGQHDSVESESNEDELAGSSRGQPVENESEDIPISGYQRYIRGHSPISVLGPSYSPRRMPNVRPYDFVNIGEVQAYEARLTGYPPGLDPNEGYIRRPNRFQRRRSPSQVTAYRIEDERAREEARLAGDRQNREAASYPPQRSPPQQPHIPEPLLNPKEQSGFYSGHDIDEIAEWAHNVVAADDSDIEDSIPLEVRKQMAKAWALRIKREQEAIYQGSGDLAGDENDEHPGIEAHRARKNASAKRYDIEEDGTEITGIKRPRSEGEYGSRSEGKNKQDSGKKDGEIKGEEKEKAWGKIREEYYQRRIGELDQLDADASQSVGSGLASVHEPLIQQAPVQAVPRQSPLKQPFPKQPSPIPQTENPLKRKRLTWENYKQLDPPEQDSPKPPTENRKRKRFTYVDYAAGVELEVESEERGRSQTRKRLNH